MRDLDPGTEYKIRVKTVGKGACADSAYSNKLTATTAKAKSTAFGALDSAFADFADDEDDEFWASFQ